MWLGYLLLLYCACCEGVISQPESASATLQLAGNENRGQVSSIKRSRTKEGPISNFVEDTDNPDASIGASKDLEAVARSLSYPQLFYEDSRRIQRTVHETANSAFYANTTRLQIDHNGDPTTDLSSDSRAVVHRGNDPHSPAPFVDQKPPKSATISGDSFQSSSARADGRKKGDQSLHPQHEQRSSRSTSERIFKASGGRYYPPAKPSPGYGAPNPVTPCPQTNPIVYPPPRPRPPPPPPPRPVPSYEVPTIPSPKPVIYPSYPAPSPSPAPVFVFIPQPGTQQQQHYRPPVVPTQQSYRPPVNQKPWLDAWLNKPHFNPLAWKAQKAQLLLGHLNKGKGNFQHTQTHVYGPPKRPSTGYGVPLEPTYQKPQPSPCSHPNHPYDDHPAEYIPSKPVINYPSPSYVTPSSYPSYGSSVSPTYASTTPAPSYGSTPSGYHSTATIFSYGPYVPPSSTAYPTTTPSSYPSVIFPSYAPKPSAPNAVNQVSYNSGYIPNPTTPYPSVQPSTYPSGPTLPYPTASHGNVYPTIPPSAYLPKPTSSPSTNYPSPGYVYPAYDTFGGKGKSVDPNYKENEILTTPNPVYPEPYQTPGPSYVSYTEPYKQQQSGYDVTTPRPVSHNTRAPVHLPSYSQFTTPQPIYGYTTSAPPLYVSTPSYYPASFTTFKYPQTSPSLYPSPYSNVPLNPQVVVVTSGSKSAEPTPLTYNPHFVAPNCSRDNGDNVGSHSQFPVNGKSGEFGPNSCGGPWRILGARDLNNDYPVQIEPVSKPHPDPVFNYNPFLYQGGLLTTPVPQFTTPLPFYTAATPAPYPFQIPNRTPSNVVIFSTTRLPIQPSLKTDFDIRTGPKGTSSTGDQEVKASLVVDAIRDALPFPPVASTPNSIIVTSPSRGKFPEPVYEGEISPFLFSRASQTGRTIPNRTTSSLPLSSEVATPAIDPLSTNSISDDVTTSQARLLSRELSNANLRVFASLLEKAGLLPLLNSLESFTLFAPTTLAFNELSSEFNFEKNLDTLRETLLYHIVPQRWSANAFLNDLTLPTSAGSARLRINVYNTSSSANTITVNGARILSFDLDVLHGVVHVIDKVLTSIPTQTVLQQLENSGLRRSILGPSLATVLEGPGPLTVFVPAPDVFFSLDDQEQALVNNATAFSEMLWYHVVPGTHYSEGLLDGQWLSTGKNAGELQVQVSADGRQRRLVGVNEAEVLRPDVTATNGVIHIINRVLSVVKRRPS